MTDTATNSRERRQDRADVQTERRRKRGGGVNTRLSISQDLLDLENFKYRWLNDTEARLYLTTRNDDWDVVSQDGGAVKEDAVDGAVRVVVGEKSDGSAVHAYLARKPRRYWESDQKQKQEDLEKQIAQMRRGMAPGERSAADYVGSQDLR